MVARVSVNSRSHYRFPTQLRSSIKFCTCLFTGNLFSDCSIGDSRVCWVAGGGVCCWSRLYFFFDFTVELCELVCALDLDGLYGDEGDGEHGEKVELHFSDWFGFVVFIITVIENLIAYKSKFWRTNILILIRSANKIIIISTSI